jgi:hypothetical protein
VHDQQHVHLVDHQPPCQGSGHLSLGEFDGTASLPAAGGWGGGGRGGGAGHPVKARLTVYTFQETWFREQGGNFRACACVFVCGGGEQFTSRHDQHHLLGLSPICLELHYLIWSWKTLTIQWV